MTEVRARVRRFPGLLRVRRLAEHAVTPTVKADLAQLADDVAALKQTVEALEKALTTLLSAVSSTNGNVELLRHELRSASRDPSHRGIGTDPPED